jgi:nucleotide-binding universal stress UspA family protein
VSAYEPVSGARVEGGNLESAVDPDFEVGAILERAAGAMNTRGVDCETHARKGGDPADAILRVAEEQDADVIMVGSKGMQGTKRFLLGSVPDKISHHAPCSVLIVRTT